ncbi:MAG TPA: thiamine pyrophosphate-binding protein [Usitatibacteraceae bacterium]|nr:thiamine pyrophosphate-binding protein [Usitatibacteraceae bacterium]
MNPSQIRGSVPAHGGERVAMALQAGGVKRIFALAGGHISPILVAAKQRGLAIIDTRDEVTAVFAADASARVSGIPGVAAVTAGPGLTNTITALKNAQLAQSPLVLIGGAAPTALQGRGALQDIDQKPLIAPHVKGLWQVRRVADLGPAIEAALFTCRNGVPGPVFVECPVDLLYDEKLIRGWYADAAGKGTALADRLLRWYLNRHAATMFAASGEAYAPVAREVQVPEAGANAIERAAHALGSAERPLIVLGSQAVVATEQVEELAAAVRSLGIPVYLSGMARGLLGREDALQMRHVRRQALREADCVLLAGVPCDFRLDYGKHVRRSAKLIAANRSARDARLNRRPDVAMIGDAGQSLIALAGRLPSGNRRDAWIGALRERDRAREFEIDAQAGARGEHVNPIHLFRQLDAIAADNAVFIADGGDFVGTASYILRPRGPLAWLDPGAFGTLGVGAGFALGAHLASPNPVEVWLVWGDGASGYGLSEFDTFVRHGIPVIAVVGNDACWTQIAREQVKMLGDDVSTRLARTAYHEVARGFGAEGIEVRHDSEVAGALSRARELAAAGRPVLVNIWLDKTDFREGSLSM